jgi:hypothetical protein
MASYANYRQYSATKYICNTSSGSQGAQGERGPAGATGPAGPQGYTGPQGARGPQGYCCVGATGATGAQGAPGPGGGLQGLQGIQGPAGTGFTTGTSASDVLTLTNNFSTPAYTFAFGGMPSPTICAISWSISLSGFSDPTNQFCITFSNGVTEYQPIINNKINPLSLNTNGNTTAGSGNDVITLNGVSTSYTVNIYQTSALYPGSQPPFVVSVTLTTL